MNINSFWDALAILHSSYFTKCQSATIRRLLDRLLVRLPLIEALSLSMSGNYIGTCVFL